MVYKNASTEQNSSGMVQCMSNNIYVEVGELLETRNYLCRVKNKDPWDKVATLRRYLNEVWDGILNAENPLQWNQPKQVVLTQSEDCKEDMQIS